MNAPAAPLVARLRAEIADLRQQLEERHQQAREEGARLAIAAAYEAYTEADSVAEIGLRIRALSIPEVLKGKP